MVEMVLYLHFDSTKNTKKNEKKNKKEEKQSINFALIVNHDLKILPGFVFFLF